VSGSVQTLGWAGFNLKKGKGGSDHAASAAESARQRETGIGNSC
jgi:hypothetical protein